MKLIPDGACLFTRGMGMSCTWESERGFGERSWRYSAVINDGKIEKIFVEVTRTPDPFFPPAPPSTRLLVKCEAAELLSNLLLGRVLALLQARIFPTAATETRASRCHCGGQGGAVVQNSGPDPFEVSDAGTMLSYLKSAKK